MCKTAFQLNRPDRIFRGPQPPTFFEFDDVVTSVFDDMLHRSIPGYDLLLKGIGLLANPILSRQPGRVYDLGSAWGHAVVAVALACRNKGGEYIAVDHAPSMVQACRSYTEAQLGRAVETIEADILDFVLRPARIVLCTFTMQFVHPAARTALLAKIYHALSPGGALILAEKCALPGDDAQAHHRTAYHRFKRINGYTEEEVVRKERALQGVLIPDTPQIHEQRLAEVGFDRVYEWFNFLLFRAWIAYK